MNNFYFQIRVKLFLLLTFCLFISKLYATTYYVSSLTGDDSRSVQQAQNISTPWKSLSGVSNQSGNFQPGDSILFKRGEIFAGTLSVSASGVAGRPIVFGAYGQGVLPELTGFATLTSWQQKNGNIWEAVVPGGLSYMNTVTVNGSAKACGRYPNASAAGGGYLYYDSYNGNTSITDSKLASLPNWSGGQIVMRKTRWIIDRNDITGQSGNTINYSSQSGYGGATGYGYFIQNHPAALDIEGEWYYQGGKLGIFTGSNPNTFQIRAGVIETLVNITNQSNLLFQNLRLSGAMVSGFAISNSQNIRISSCEVLFSGRNAISASSTDGLTIENSTIASTGNDACNVNGNGAVLSNNQIHSTGIYAGMGDGGDGTYEGVVISGDNNLVTNNTIDSTGYIPLTFSGNNVTVKNNVVSNFALTKDDGGGIYTWNNGQNAPVNSGRTISGNIVLNGVGAPGGTDNVNKSYAHGIYIDDNAGQVAITNNTVTNCATYGIYIHNAHDITIKQNTLYNNAITQLVMEHDNVAPDKPVYNCTVTGNILYAKQIGQLSAEYKTKDNDISNFGTFDQNYYYRPLDNDLVIGVLQQVNGVYSYNTLSLESWKALYGKDANSVKSSHQIPAFTVNNVTGGNQYANGTFDSNIGGLYAYASAGNCVTSWDNGTMDGGSLKISFSSTTGSSNYGSVIIGIGAVTAGKQYRLKFSMLGGNNYKAISAYLRQSTGSYSDLSVRMAGTISGTRVEKSLLLTATANESNASIVFDVPEQLSPVYLDNIRLEQVNATVTNPDSYITFLDNTTATGKTYSTTRQSYDAAGNSYNGSIKLDPFSSAVLATDSMAVTTTNTSTTAAACSATGTILREEWDNATGNTIADIPLQQKPTSTSQLTSFEGPANTISNYGSRIRGYICPPQTGSYTFWIASDDAGELWLSTDSTVANKVRIANVDSWTNYREWNKFPSQKSVAITLQAGKKYYVEALQKQGGGGDDLSIQWQLPDATMETPIAGSHLSPYSNTASTNTTVATGSGSITRDEWDNVGGTNISDIPLQTKPASTSQVTSFEGPVNIAYNYGSRIRGYVYPPQTGSYTFWIATDDAGELWLSTDDNPANKTRIANVDGWTNYREWGKYASQKSVAITLQAGKKYYIEALQKQGGGGDNLSVQWQLPDGTMETPIAGIHLSPYTVALADQTITFAALVSKTTSDPPFTLTATASSGLAVSFRIVSGPATVSGSTVTITGAGTVTIEASQAGNSDYNAAAVVTQSFAVSSAAATCSATGTILREEWDNVPGNNISDFAFQATPTSTSMLTSFEGPVNIAQNYASRIRGYICAPQTGNYTFWVAGDDAAELYLSTDDNPANKVRIANLLSWTNFREWTKFASQQSAAIMLQAGKKYYVEAIQKQGGGGDNLSVQWQLPDGTVESPLPGKYLSPYISQQVGTSSLNAARMAADPLAITTTDPASATVKTGLFVYPNPVSTQTTVDFAVAEAGQTDIALYNTHGQLVSRLFSGSTEANTKNTVVVNAETLQSGVYIIHLTCGQTVLTKKIIVVK